MTRTPLDHPFPIPPDAGTTLEVAPGIHWLRMALPFALDHINLWLLEDGDGWAIVDTGVNDEATRAAWVTVLAGKRVTKLICTHFHPDHMGLAGWLAQRHQVPLTATLGEWSFGRMLTLDVGDDYHANQVEHYRRAGYGEDLLAGVRQRSGAYGTRVAPLPASISDIRDGSRIIIGGRLWQVVEGRGHSPQHACLWCAEAGVLISGDQVLPRISPIVGVWPQQPDDDPLRDFLTSLDTLKQLPDDALVLPSHGLPFLGLHARCDDLIRHHETRLTQLLEAATEPTTALDLAHVLFRRALDPQQLGFAMGETLAHANCLIERGLLKRDLKDGVWLYVRME
ncbi:MAG: MBL fold metallo-hydrolase [Rhodospirillaceae bacterium]|nr:MBL fold metallo-hydrolase [Rhodospirillales bacterium]